MSRSAAGAPQRLSSVDAYRGFVMFLMLAEVLRFCAVAAAVPDSVFWRFLCHQQTHAEWAGCSLHDLIQPSFVFLVGVAVPFSIASRRARGATTKALAQHAAVRALLLIFLGMALRAMVVQRWEFDETLTQIGLGYPFVFLLAFRPARDRWMVLGLILAGYWLLFACWPSPGPDFDFPKAGVSQEWLREYGLSGFSAHWQKNANPATAFDLWFLNLFPRGEPYAGGLKGLATLNFVPMIATLILGLMAGNLLRRECPPGDKLRQLAATGALALAAGWALGALGICPVVKSIWTSSWVLFSGGWCLLLLAAFFALVEIANQRMLVFPLVVIGMNSLVAYLLAQIYPRFAFHSIQRLAGRGVFRMFGDAYEPLLYGAAVLLAYWLFLFVLYRRRAILRL